MPEHRFELGRIISEFVYQISVGGARELGAFSARGEAKTTGALAGMWAHSVQHEKAGYSMTDHGQKVKHKLPVPWIGFTDFHTSHKNKTVKSLEADHWQGAWQTFDDSHLAVLTIDGIARVRLELFGIEDKGAHDKVRTECVGVWCEEPAPATEGPGVDETTWNISLGSQRIPTHARVAVFTTNYPDKSHWTWKRMNPGLTKPFGVNPDDATRMWFRVPIGDNPYVSQAQRDETRHALRDRPDLLARLVDGRPGAVALGRAVAVVYHEGVPMGFNEEKHTAPQRLKVVKGVPIYVGQDGGHCCDDQTDVLTDKGWFLFKDLPPIGSIKFATLNPETKEIKYQGASRYVRFDYDGPLYEWSGRQGVNMCVTPDHRVPWFDDHDRARRLRWATAEEVACAPTDHQCVFVDGRWNGDDECGGPLQWSTKTFCRFMGWYLSEGSTEGRGRIQIAQRNEKYMNQLWSDMIATGLEWHPGKDRLRASNQELAGYLEQFGLSDGKFVPQEIKSASRENILEFIDAYSLGDGYIRNREDHGEEHIVFTKSKKMADDLQELALKVGWWSSINWEPPDDRYYAAEDRIVHGSGGYRVRFKKGEHNIHLLRKNLNKIDYCGEVFCVTVPNGIIYTRRRGRPSWTGNCPATTIGQPIRGRLNVLASLTPPEHAGMKQQYEYNVVPWFQEHAPWALKQNDLVVGIYDPALPDDESDSDKNPLDVCQQKIGGYWEPGPVDWFQRKEALFNALTKTAPGSGFEAALQIDPVEGQPLIEALGGRWYIATDRNGNVTSDRPKKPNMPWCDLGDSACYLFVAMLAGSNREKPKDQDQQFSRFDARFLDDPRVSGGQEQFDPRL